MNWSLKRKTIYLSLLFAFILAIVIPIGFSLYPEASCFDGKQNQDEKGVDCDGKCEKVCLERTADLKVLWSRAFPVSKGIYGAVAYVSNPNFNLGAKNVPYIFKLYDDKSVLVGERYGVAEIIPNSNFPIFEGAITTGGHTPSKTFFEFVEVPKFSRFPEQPVLSVKNRELGDENGAPRLSATIVNDNIFPVEDISVVAILYDSKGTAIAASETIIDDIQKSSSKEVIFTWPSAFGTSVGRIEIYPKFLVR